MRITQKRVIFEISIVGFWSGSADNRPICYQEVRLGPKSSQKIFGTISQKFMILSKKVTPPPFLRKNGGGGGGGRLLNVV